MVDEPELSDCPFCGKKAGLLRVSDNVFRVYCVDIRCSAKQIGSTRDAAITAWNRRAPNPHAALLERMVEALRQADSDFLDCGRQFMSLAERGVSTSGVSRSDLCGRYAARCAASVALIRAALADYDAMKGK